MTRHAPPPARTLHTLDGLLMARVCTPEHGCVWSQVVLCLKIDEDGSWVMALHDPGDPMRGSHVAGDAGAGVFTGMLARIARLSPE